MTRTNRYSNVTIILHWVIAALVIANIAIAELTEDFPKEARGFYMDYHKAFGITVLVLTIVLIAWRLGRPKPPLPANMPGWQVTASNVVHFLFYLLLIGLPLGGWLWMSTYPGNMVSYFGIFDVPALPVQGQKTLGETLHEGHEIGGKIMLILVIVHIAAVAKHHLIDKRQIIKRMIPG